MQTWLLTMSVIPYMVLKYRKAIYMLQQNSYNVSNRYRKWLWRNRRKVFFTYELFLLFPLGILFLVDSSIGFLLMVISFFLSFEKELQEKKREQQKKKFGLTSRVKRLCLTLFFLFSLGILFLLRETGDLFFFSSFFLTFGYFSYILTDIANILNFPVEKVVYCYYRQKAKKKLKNMPYLKVVGITGSYGKTSCKNILHAILSTTLNSYPTPKSLNTPYGLMTAINRGLDKFDDVFIAEMGACKRKDIRLLCDLVKPQYGMISTIGVAHLETFKTEEAIQKTKFELVESLPEEGLAILNRDDPKQRSYPLLSKCRVKWIGIQEDADVMAKNIQLSYQGTRFFVQFKGDHRKYLFTTKLLGYHNIYNILEGIALGQEFQVPISSMQRAISSLRPSEHRLELRKYKDFYLIDDAFNSNPVGSKMALDVLKMMPGKKIVVTPGMIELGNRQYAFNFQWGEQIADVCDEVILIGKKQTKPILEGLKKKQYPSVSIHILQDVKSAFSLLEELKEEATYVLLENDLPDLFNE